MLAISQSLFFVVFEVFVVHLSSLPSFKTPPGWQSLFDSHRQRRWFSLIELMIYFIFISNCRPHSTLPARKRRVISSSVCFDGGYLQQVCAADRSGSEHDFLANCPSPGISLAFFPNQLRPARNLLRQQKRRHRPAPHQCGAAIRSKSP